MIIVDFLPSSSAPFQFNAELEGQTYVVIVTWSLFGRRFYVNLYDLAGTLITARPMIGSPAGITLQGLSWRRGVVTALTKVPHRYRVGSVVKLSISGTTPVEYSGTFLCSITDPNTFTYDLAADPGDASVFGNASFDVNLVAGYFQTASLVFRQPSQQFEVGP